MLSGATDMNFPRLGQMIVDYENPLRKLAEEFSPHNKVLLQALTTVAPVYARRNLTAEQWKAVQMLSLTAAPNQLLFAAQTETIPCEYLSLDQMDRWIILGLTLYHQAIGQPGFFDLWQRALETSLVTRLYRDEVIQTHHFVQTFFEPIKGYSKRITEIKEAYNIAVQNAALIHRERRKYLRNALKELTLILSDQPGLLGPKVLFVLMGLSFARDEVCWLLRHQDHWPQKSAQKARGKEDVVDRQLPELLFYIEELRSLVLKYSQVIQRYYLQYLSGYDAISLNEIIQNAASIPEDESIILSSFCQQIGELNVEALH